MLSESIGYFIDDNQIYYKNDDFIELMKLDDGKLLYSNNYLSAIFGKDSLVIQAIHSKVEYDFMWSSKNAIQMAYLLQNLNDEVLINY